MPPKKQPDKKKGKEDEPSGYNVNVMTIDQLKQYARLLEGEIEDMRRHCNFYQKTEDELVELLRIAEEDLKYDEEVLLLKDVELEKLKLNFLNHLPEKRQLPTYMEHRSSETKEKMSAEISARLEEEENRHISETKKLKSILQEKNRQLEALKVKIEMGRREAKERNEECLRDMGSSQEKVLEQAIERYGHAKIEAEVDFKQALEMINFEAREGKIRGERNFNEACMSFKQKLHNYYKEITKQDLETIKKLKNKIVKIEESIKKSKSLFEKAKEEEKELKRKAKSKINNRNGDIYAKFDAGPFRIMEAFKIHNKTEKLSLDNQNLDKQIKDITEKTKNLKRQFTTALGKIRDSAEMKVEFLDKKLNFIVDGDENETAVDSTITSSSERLSSEESMSRTETPYSDTSDNL